MQDIHHLNDSNYLEQNIVPSFTALQTESLFSSLISAARQNIEDFRRSPENYFKSLFWVTKSESKRLVLLFSCLVFSFCMFVTAIIVIIILSFLNHRAEVNTAMQKEEELQLISMLEPIPPPPAKKEGGAGFGAKQAGKGGGGGGNQEKTPASKGRLPEASKTAPQIVAPTTHQRIENPSLPVSPIIRADPNLLPKQNMNLPIGNPNGIPGPPSDGSGKGGGIGNGKGGGVGSGDGGGAGPGKDGGYGGGTAGGPGGGGAGSLRPTIISQVKPKYTEEARQNKIQGKVVLSVEFRADGSIGDIRFVKTLGYGLDENAIAAARQIRFRPATREGTPVTTRAKVEFTFNLI